MKKVLLVFLFCFAQLAYSQNITTVVGTGVAGYSGDGGQATDAEINNLNALYADPVGVMYVSDAYNHVIRKIKGGGFITTIAGNGTAGFSGDGGHATAAQLNNPAGVVADSDGTVYIGDYYNHCIRKVTFPFGIISTIAGTPTISGYSGDGGPATAAHFNRAYAVTLDGHGNLYCADQYNHRIRKIHLATGIITTVAGTGVAGYSGDGGQATDAKIYYPNYVHSDIAGNLFITDNGNHCIRKVDATTGIITRIAGTGVGGFSGDGGPATAAQLKFPGGVNIDTFGNLFIADGYNYLVRKVNTAGVITTIAGTPDVAGYAGDGGPATACKLNVPIDIGVDYLDGVYIADNMNNRVRKISCVQPVIAPIIGIDTVCIDSSVVLSDTTVGGVWSRRNGRVSISGSGIITGVSVGLDTVEYKVGNSCTIGTVFYPVYVKNCNTTGFRELPGNNGGEITISPNPTTGSFTIEMPKNKSSATVRITDIFGREVQSVQFTNASIMNLSLSDAARGIYFVEIRTDISINRVKVELW